MIQVTPGSWELCIGFTDKAACEVQCKWHPVQNRCVGLEDAAAGDPLVEQPKIRVVDANGELVHISGGHKVKASLVEGVTGASGAKLQSLLQGTLEVPIINGYANFTNLMINKEGQVCHPFRAFLVHRTCVMRLCMGLPLLYVLVSAFR
jgi:hypothetical protein